MTWAIMLYLIFLLLFVAYSFAGIYHLMRFGYAGDLTKPVAFLYIFISIAVVVVTIIFLLNLPQAPINEGGMVL